MKINCYGKLKTLYYLAFVFIIFGVGMEIWDIRANIPFTYWFTGALALVTLMKIPHRLCEALMSGGMNTWLPVIELCMGLAAYSYLTYLNIEKKKQVKTGSVQLNLQD